MKKAPSGLKIGPDTDFLEISLRAYVPKRDGRRPIIGQSNQGPSEYTLIFDTETTIDASQSLRFGVYQVRKGDELFASGVFLDPKILKTDEIALLEKSARAHGLEFMPVASFIDDVFFGIGYDLRATIVGFNLPFDLSRLAIRHGSARGKLMQGGFTFQLSEHKYRPNVQIRHLSARSAIIQFPTRVGRFDTRGMRKRRQKALPRRGYFIDIRTLAAALTSQSFSLKSLAAFLKTPHRKAETDEHGGTLTEAYIHYAVQDVEVTWDCYRALLDKFARHNFKETPPHKIYSEAGIGKAYFKELNIRPWQGAQPDFPDSLIGIIMSAYFGGRSEVHSRRTITRVAYCDFLSMYPTVCTLMRLWRFMTATGITWRNNTKEVREFLKGVTLKDIQDPKLWPKLATLVQIIPDRDILPIRATYGGNEQQTIGLNYLTSTTPLWFTLADLISSKFISGKIPRILKAITFEPKEPQESLNPINIAGNPDYRIDPYKDDLFKRLIDLRNEVKERREQFSEADRSNLDAEQLALKIIANSTSYGIFIELNVEDLAHPEDRLCCGYSGKPFRISTNRIEKPGQYFHPLLATLITGAARLMLAVTETLANQNGLDWAFCDTDSMAIAKPDGVDATFNSRIEIIRNYFDPLNPYSTNQQLLKLEDENYRIRDGKLIPEVAPLYFFGISAKRYALFNIDENGRIAIRKASGHGLGHLIAPYREPDATKSILAPILPLSKIGVDRWQHDIWHQIIRAALDGHPNQINLDYHPALNLPAASRYAATTPPLQKWFKQFNLPRHYLDQVRPFGFMMAFQAWPTAILNAGKVSISEKRASAPKPIAPFDAEIERAASNCFDRETGRPVDINSLKTYREVLAQYHLRPESKFLNGEYLDRGLTHRRHVEVASIRNIGKEANHWEEQFYLGADEGEQINYGNAPDDSKRSFRALRTEIKAAGQRRIARESGVSRRTIDHFLGGKSVRRTVVARIVAALRAHNG